LRQKGPHQNGAATKWAMRKRVTTKRAAPKWSHYKVVYPNNANRIIIILVFFC